MASLFPRDQSQSNAVKIPTWSFCPESLLPILWGARGWHTVSTLWRMMMICVYVSAICGCLTNYPKFSSLKQYICNISSFLWRQEFRQDWCCDLRSLMRLLSNCHLGLHLGLVVLLTPWAWVLLRLNSSLAFDQVPHHMHFSITY